MSHSHKNVTYVCKKHKNNKKTWEKSDGKTQRYLRQSTKPAGGRIYTATAISGLLMDNEDVFNGTAQTNVNSVNSVRLDI